MRARGTRGGILLSLGSEDTLALLDDALREHAELLAGTVIIEIAEKVPFDHVALVAERVEAAGGAIKDVRPPSAIIQARSETVIVGRTVRSGGRIVSGGSIVVLGDVNAGAELVADGDVIVTGLLRGMAHAGASGNEKALIYAERILAAQLRIAGALAQGDPAAGEAVGQRHEVALLQGGAIVVRPWSSGAGG
jgi:septum site-determining protein MinC